MPSAAYGLPTPDAQPVPSAIATLQRTILWLAGAGGGIVFIEPSPFELATLLAFVFFGATGLRVRPAFVPLALMLIAINIGYSISASGMLGDPALINWILTSWYMSVMAVFYALVLADDTKERLDYLCRGYVVGAVIASLAGIAGYFHAVPGAYDLLTLYNRARGTFKDPNVLGAFLILPALISLQGVMDAKKLGRAILSALTFGIIALAVLLSFSRAAWGQLVATSAAMLILMFFTARAPSERTRIVVLAAAAAVVAALAVAAILSMDSVSSLFKERASFGQSYDSGRFGRFGRHILGFDMALDYPLGIGPLQFSRYFPEDTHNSFLNAFMSGGWISGIVYPAMILMSVIFASRSVFARTPWQRQYLAVYAAFLGTVCESAIIDTDHWRHFFLSLGMVWGVTAATREWRAAQSATAGMSPIRRSR